MNIQNDLEEFGTKIPEKTAQDLFLRPPDDYSSRGSYIEMPDTDDVEDIIEAAYKTKNNRNQEYEKRVTHWTEVNKGSYISSPQTTSKITAGVYKYVRWNNDKYCFQRQPINVDELLVMPDSVSDKILSEIQDFLNKTDKYKYYNFLHRRGYMFYGPHGCHSKGTEVIMYDGSFKKVEDVKVGDLLMGPDSRPRTVLELRSGIDEMFEVNPTKGEPFIVNKNHILHLTPSGKGKAMAFHFPLNIKLSDYLTFTKPSKERFLLQRAPAIELPVKEQTIPPYILGVWLGDGTHCKPEMTNIDPEVIEAWKSYACEINQSVTSVRNTDRYNIINKKGSKNPFIEKLRELGVWRNKYVPANYILCSIAQRLQLLAGLLDTDGYHFHGGYEFVNKNEQIADSVLYIARSIGLAAYKSKTIKGCWVQQRKHYKEGVYYRISISGFTDVIPCKILRKKATTRKQIKDVTRTGFELISLGEGEYYGFTLNEDHLYLTSDFTIHHNSGKSSLVQQILKKIVDQDGIVLLCESPALLELGLLDLRKVEKDRFIVCLFEDIDALIQKFGEKEILAVLDGESQVNKVLNVATTNYPETLDPRIVGRPRRFDRVIRIDWPSAEMRKHFFKHKLKIEDTEIDKWVAATDKFSFAACAELVISVKCLDKSFEESLKILRALMDAKPNSNDYDIKTEKFGFQGTVKK